MKEMIALQVMKGTKTRTDLMKKLDKIMVKHGLGYLNLVSVVTEVAPPMLCKKWHGGFSKEKVHFQAVDLLQLIVYHCIIHQEHISKSLDLKRNDCCSISIKLNRIRMA
jgi:hypothetical protein